METDGWSQLRLHSIPKVSDSVHRRVSVQCSYFSHFCKCRSDEVLMYNFSGVTYLAALCYM